MNETTGKQLRNELEALLAENTAAEREIAQRQTNALLTDAGFAPDSPEGRALALAYDGEPDPVKVREFASERYGWVSPDEAEQREAREAAEIRAAWASVADVAGSSTPTPVEQINPIARAEAEGDWETFDRLNAERLQEMRRTHSEYRSPST